MDTAAPFPPHDITKRDCRTFSEALSRVGDKWTIYVVGTLGDGPLRYKEIQHKIDGISQRMLTLTLKSLEADGLVSRTVFPTIPPRVDYELTPLGYSLRPALSSLFYWVMLNRDAIETSRAAYAARLEKVQGYGIIDIRFQDTL
jgi:DNA-binding HxlR family transcriptional regulator